MDNMAWYRWMKTGFICFCICIIVIGTAASVPGGRVQYPGEKEIVPGIAQADSPVDSSSHGYASAVDPVHVGSISHGGDVILRYPRGVFVAGNYAYVTGYGSNNLEIVDISNPADPIHAASISYDGDVKLYFPISVFVAGNYAYITSYDGHALEIMDVSNPQAPVHAASISNEGDVKLKFPRSVFVAGNYAYVASFGSKRSRDREYIKSKKLPFMQGA